MDRYGGGALWPAARGRQLGRSLLDRLLPAHCYPHGNTAEPARQPSPTVFKELKNQNPFSCIPFKQTYSFERTMSHVFWIYLLWYKPVWTFYKTYLNLIWYKPIWTFYITYLNLLWYKPIWTFYNLYNLFESFMIQTHLNLLNCITHLSLLWYQTKHLLYNPFWTCHVQSHITHLNLL